MIEDHVPKRIKHIKFGCMDPKDLRRQGVIELSTREMYNIEGGERKPVPNGVLDRRMV
jgi:DNA-directed RNA polymerase III subunit RPC1